jgi:hypothetical protein
MPPAAWPPVTTRSRLPLAWPPTAAGLRVRAHRLAAARRVAVGQNLDRLHRLVLDELSEVELIDWSRGCIDSVGRGPTASQRRAWQALVAAFA